jgi:protein-tyrosine phosphatase
MAAAIARDALGGGGGIEVASAGTYAIVGSGPTADAIAVAVEHGLSLDGHRARQLTTELVAGADLVIGMEREHAAFARRLGAADATTLGVPVRDPYGLGRDAYRKTWSLLASLVSELVQTIRAPRE